MNLFSTKNFCRPNLALIFVLSSVVTLLLFLAYPQNYTIDSYQNVSFEEEGNETLEVLELISSEGAPYLLVHSDERHLLRVTPESGWLDVYTFPVEASSIIEIEPKNYNVIALDAYGSVSGSDTLVSFGQDRQVLSIESVLSSSTSSSTSSSSNSSGGSSTSSTSSTTSSSSSASGITKTLSLGAGSQFSFYLNNQGFLTATTPSGSSVSVVGGVEDFVVGMSENGTVVFVASVGVSPVFSVYAFRQSGAADEWLLDEQPAAVFEEPVDIKEEIDFTETPEMACDCRYECVVKNTGETCGPNDNCCSMDVETTLTCEGPDPCRCDVVTINAEVRPDHECGPDGFEIVGVGQDKDWPTVSQFCLGGIGQVRVTGEVGEGGLCPVNINEEATCDYQCTLDEEHAQCATDDEGNQLSSDKFINPPRDLCYAKLPKLNEQGLKLNDLELHQCELFLGDAQLPPETFRLSYWDFLGTDQYSEELGMLANREECYLMLFPAALTTQL